MMVEGTLIRIILGILVIVAVGVGLFFFFKFVAIDFFKNIMGGEEAEKEIQPSKLEPPKSILEICREKIEKGEYKSQEECFQEEPGLCETCEMGLLCREKECFEISKELEKFGKKCEYISRFSEGLNKARCNTINI